LFEAPIHPYGLARIFIALALATAIFAVAPSTASAQPLTCGQVITEDTMLENDLTDCSGDGIVIGAEGITLDLNGHTVTGSLCDTDCPPNNGVDNTAGYDRVRILNGTIRSFEHSVALVGAEENILAGLTVGGFPVQRSFIGLFLSHSNDNELDAITALGGDPAVLLSASDRNRISGSSLQGGVSIRVGRSLAFVDGSDENEVERSQLGGEEGAGIFDSTANRFVRNQIDGGHEGIALASARGTVISHNTLTSSGFGAITIVTYSASDENVIRDNEMPSGGIRIVGDRNRIEHNNVQGRFAYLDESAIEILSGDANLVLHNRARGGADGIAVRSGATATLIQGNAVVDAMDDGVDIDAPGTVVRANSANDNGDLGIEAVEGVIDGGGNRAAGNGNPLQCLNVVCH
jgi:parallel beta-helix repeat protein